MENNFIGTFGGTASALGLGVGVVAMLAFRALVIDRQSLSSAPTRAGLIGRSVLATAGDLRRWRSDPSQRNLSRKLYTATDRAATAALIPIIAVAGALLPAIDSATLVRTIGWFLHIPFVGPFLSDLVRVAFSVGVLAGIPAGILARNAFARNLDPDSEPEAARLHAAVMLPILAAGTACVALSMAAKPFLEIALPRLFPTAGQFHPAARLESFLFNVAAVTLVAVVTAWAYPRAKALGAIFNLFVMWWVTRLALGFTVGLLLWMFPRILSPALEFLAGPHFSLLVWTVIYLSAAAVGWNHSRDRLAKRASLAVIPP